jgi:hypothetical protein
VPSRLSVEAILQSIAKAERHIRSEYGTRMIGVMDTVGANPHFAMMAEPGLVKVLSGRPDIDAMYMATVEYAVPQASRLLSQTVTDWYVFVENVPTRLWIADGEMRTVQTATMFVTDDANGLSGEYAWQKYYDTGPGLSGKGDPLPDRALANLQLHCDLIDAICRGDSAALSGLLDPGCIWAQRNYLSDAIGGEILDLRSAGAAADHIAAWHDTFEPEGVTILNRKVTDWFVFAEELWLVRPGGERRQYRTATIYPVNAAGRFEGALGFGQDPEAPSPSAVAGLGRAFWPEPWVDMDPAV